MNVQHLARWSSALALVASLAWAQEPTTPPAGPAEASPQPAAEVAAPAPETPAPAAPEAAKPSRSLRGRIVDTKSKDPLPGATVSIKGTPASAMADENGNFVLNGVPDGKFTLHVEEQDHVRRDVPVDANVASITVELNQSYVEELVVVGRASEMARKNLANAVSTVKADDLSRSPSATVDAALQGKVAGANIQGNSGAPGGGMQIKLRGVSTINGANSPLYVVDGVIISDVAISNGINAVTKSNAGSNPAPVQDDQVNRIADLNPNDIANIEILKGASAAAIYGSKASNGVVIITTKKAGIGGGGNEPRVELTQRVGTYQLANRIPQRTFTSFADAQSVWGDTAKAFWKCPAGQTTCADDQRTAGTFDHQGELSPGGGPSTETYASLAGGVADTSYFASALLKSDKGVVTNTGYDKQSARLNIDHHFGDALDVQLNSNVVHSLAARGMFNNDNNNVSAFMVLSSTPSFIDLRQRADGTWPVNPFIGLVGTNPLQTVALMHNDEDVWRLITSGDALWKIWSNREQELKLAANIGVDRFQQKNLLLFPPELNFEPVDDGLAGTSISATAENLNLNYGINLVHTFRPTGGGPLNLLTSSIGAQREDRTLDSTYIITRGLVAGQSNVNEGTQVVVNEQRQRATDRGFYIQEEALTLEERLQLVAALRMEQSSLNGDANALLAYPKAAASYRIGVLPTQYFDELKVRLAYGETGNQPIYGMRYTGLTVANVNGFGGVVVNPVAGNAGVKPERQREFEGGIDALMLGGNLVVELTGYQRTIDDLLLRRNVAPSTGFLTEIFNGGQMINRGVEAMVQVTPFDNPGGFGWNSRTTFALNRSVISRLDVPPFIFGAFGARYGAFEIEQGKSATQIVGNDGTEVVTDSAGNPVIDPVTGQPKLRTLVHPLGDAEPNFRMSFLNDFHYGAFTLSTNLDWQQGSSIINFTRQIYDAFGNSPDVEAAAARVDSVEHQLKAAPYIEDASFLKIREISLGYELPKTIFQGAFKVVRHAKLTVSGRNLWCFTKYTGLDPEVSNFGNQAIARNVDLAPYPPSRSFWGSIELGF
ncbi:MAG TPA: SusC/RagA family TonB-linked outer membrane protein [Myxococcaceae bacterium]|nr:SusC/RagA family TonB-linked outer membrane protein [Myxococcaceae bacterium]